MLPDGRASVLGRQPSQLSMVADNAWSRSHEHELEITVDLRLTQACGRVCCTVLYGLAASEDLGA